MTTQYKTYAPAELDALQSRFALRITSALDERTREVPHDVSERLRVAREKALERARLSRRTVEVPQLALAGMPRQASASGGDGWWVRLGAVLPLIVLVGGLMLIQRLHVNSQISAAAEIDAALLADAIPPSAYADPGFVEFLKAPPN